MKIIALVLKSIVVFVGVVFVLAFVVSTAPVVVIDGANWLTSILGMQSDIIVWKTVDRFGQFGDSFGVVTSIATVIALLLLFKTYNLQRKEFTNLHDSMAQQTRWSIVMQLCEQYREVMAHTVVHCIPADYNRKGMSHTVVRDVPDDIRGREDAAVNLVKPTDILGQAEIRGREGLRILISRAVDAAVNLANPDPVKPKDIARQAEIEFNPYEGCFRLLHRIFTVIDEQECSDKEKQKIVRILRAMLSNIELEGILINCLTERGEGMEKFIVKFAILNNYTPVDLDEDIAFDFCEKYASGAFGNDNLFLKNERERREAENRPPP